MVTNNNNNNEKRHASVAEAIPAPYRFVLSSYEPFFAVGAALMATFRSESYVATMSRSSITYSPEHAFAYTMLGGAFVLFAFLLVVVLRVVDDVRSYRAIIAGMLLMDVFYFTGAAQAVGGWWSFLNPAYWTVEDYFMNLTGWPPILVRVLVLFEIGFTASNGRASGKTA
ncbi:hypothetical protein CDEST_11711 [Colletotrichum destructivum]|uniref:DUF7704 domain-containing protein n=1 Tax=Colletotrichum destructivum TaxID=34406 RepID=A0AAX4ITY5_9PEZI|nr:hypothetical protein CDEST_11711 [Colletotrichum destructivum]